MLSDPHTLRWLIALIGLVCTLGALVLLAQRYGKTWRKKFGGNLLLIEQISLDARYKMVVVEDGEARHTLVLGPQQAISIGKSALSIQKPLTTTKAKKKK